MLTGAATSYGLTGIPVGRRAQRSLPNTAGELCLHASQHLRKSPRPFVSCSKKNGQPSQRIKSRSNGNQKATPKSKPIELQQSIQKQQLLTAPMQVRVEAQLSKLEQAANPWWSTFCGVTNGRWAGQTAAFAPSTGEAEPVAKTSTGKPILDLFTHSAEDRVCKGPEDYVLRCTVESESEAELAFAASNAALSDVEEDSVYSDELGLVFFDGGSYSRGPLCLAEDRLPEAAQPVSSATESVDMHQGNGGLQRLHVGNDDADDEAIVAAEADEGGSRGPHEAGRVVTLEQCLTWGGEQRKRCRITLAVSGGGETGEELDISLLHVRLYHETWQGMLQILDDATLRANSAVPIAPEANASTKGSAEHCQHATLQQEVNTQKSAQQQLPEESAAGLSAAGSNLEQHSEAKEEAMGNSMEVQLQHEARLQSGQQASSSTTDTSQQHQVSAPQCGGSSGAAEGTPGAVARADMSQEARMHSQQLEGSWKVFDLAAVPIDETDVDTGVTRKAMVYFSQETQQSWSSGVDILNAESQQNEEGDVDGGALWLPGNVILELQMLPMVSRGEVADKVEGLSTSNTGRGVLLTFSWMVRSGMVISMQREYDATGDLMEVRSRSAVEGSWVGGRM